MMLIEVCIVFRRSCLELISFDHLKYTRFLLSDGDVPTQQDR
jgi:hypothetical protein